MKASSAQAPWRWNSGQLSVAFGRFLGVERKDRTQRRKRDSLSHSSPPRVYRRSSRAYRSAPVHWPVVRLLRVVPADLVGQDCGRVDLTMMSCPAPRHGRDGAMRPVSSPCHERMRADIGMNRGNALGITLIGQRNSTCHDRPGRHDSLSHPCITANRSNSILPFR
jgi:hypothetical protein